MEDNYGDRDADKTDPGTPASVRALAAAQFAIGAAHVSRVVPLLEQLGGSEREYFAGRLADDLAELLEQGAGLVELIRFAGPK
jgi:hypothetical protein